MDRAAQLTATITRYVSSTWLGCTFVVGVIFCFLMPPFQTNDETHHWERLYSVMQFHRHCTTVPQGVEEVISANVAEQIQGGWKWQFRRLDDALKVVPGEPLHHMGYPRSCSYPFIGYLVPALVARIGQWVWPTTWGKLFVAFYLARLGNWLSLTLCVWLAMRLLPRLRAWIVAVYSVPMVIHQSASINQDAAIVGLHLLLLIVLCRTRPFWKLIGVTVISFVLWEMKIVFAPLFLLLAIPLWELAAGLGAKRRRQLFLGLLVPPVVVLLSSPWWIARFLRGTLGNEPGVFWSDPKQQTELIIQQPSLLLHALLTQLSDNLGHGHLTGGFTSIIGVFGWAQHEIPEPAYRAALWALLWSAIADMIRPAPADAVYGRDGSWLEWIWCRFVPALIPPLVIFLIEIGFYVVFTAPGKTFIIGVQGRYYFGPLLLFIVALIWWGAARVDRLALRLSRFQPRLETLRALVAGLLISIAFCEMWTAWSASASMISDVYYHHAQWW